MKSVETALMDTHNPKPYKLSSVKPAMIYMKKLAGGEFNDLDFLLDRKVIDEKLGGYAVSTRRTIIFTIMNVARAMKRHDIMDLYDEDRKHAEKRTDVRGEKTEKQKENWMTWDEIIAKRDALRDSSTADKQMQYVALSLYTMVPPRRNRDYAEMDIKNRLTKSLPKTRNYLVVNKSKMRFVFNVFKTDQNYGQQVVAVPKDLEAVLRRYIGMLENKTGPLFGTGVSSTFMTRLLNSALGGNVGSSMLRHIFISHFTSAEDKAVIERMFNTADAMAHSVGTQQGTYRKD